MNATLKERRSDQGFFSSFLRGRRDEVEVAKKRRAISTAPEKNTRQLQSFGVPSGAIGAAAVGALALGAFSIGALAIGFLAIRRFAVGKARIRSLKIKELDVQCLRVSKLEIADYLLLPGADRSTSNSTGKINLTAFTGS